jgi:homoserine dehydrogenase
MNSKTYNLALVGFGNVGRAFVRLLRTKCDILRDQYGIEFRVTGVASRRLGWLATPDGFEIGALCAGQFAAGAGQMRPTNVRDWLLAAQPDVLFEVTSLNRHTGEPASDHIRAALEHGAHAISANKGPVVFHLDELNALAHKAGKRFLYESSVMDGTHL